MLINILMIKNLGKKKMIRNDLNTIVYTTLEIIRKISFMLYPIIPDSSLKALKIFNINENEIIFSTISNHNFLKLGNKVKLNRYFI